MNSRRDAICSVTAGSHWVQFVVVGPVLAVTPCIMVLFTQCIIKAYDVKFREID